jgi:hypothetical protein
MGRNFMNQNEKLIALLGGGDWADASVEHVIIPTSMNLEAEKANYEKWYTEVYCPALQRRENPDYVQFCQWLIERGARLATENDVTEFWDD